jgi:1-acyl-sn-glycerol-3-phosphate acyltransferase
MRRSEAKAAGAGDPVVPISRREVRPIWRVLQATVIPLMYLIVGMKRQGTANIPREGAFVISPNHTSNLDPIIVGIAVFLAGRTPHFLGKASLFRVPIVRSVLTATGQIPVDRGTGRSDPLASAHLVAASGSGVIVYPEGTLTRDPDIWPMRGKTGAVRLALAAGIPLIPTAQWGTQSLLPPYARFVRLIPRRHIIVRFGEPLDLSAFAGKPLDSRTMAAATDLLMQAITDLVAELRDEKAPTTRWNPAAHNQSEFGHP